MQKRKPPGRGKRSQPGSKQAASPKRKASAPKALAAVTQPADPSAYGSRGIVFLNQRSTAGVAVTEDTAMSQSAVWACIRVISESLAGMPWLVGRRLKDGTIEPEDRADLDWLLNYQPNPETQSFAFRETLWAWALGWGNGYAEIERDFAGNPVNLWQLHPSRVCPVRDRNGKLFYEVANERRPPDYLPQRDVFHLMGPSPDGLIGWSVIRLHARTIGLAIAQEENASTFNANDSTPGGLLIHPGKLTDPARKNLEESWNRRHKGPSNRRTVAILEEAMKWEQTGMSPDDAKLVEQMQLTPAMISRVFRVPPHKIAATISGSSGTYNNNENQDIEFVKDTLRPWAERGEAEADVKLFGRNNQARLVTFIDLSERERGDTAARTQHVKEMLFCGVYTINMSLKYLGLPGIGPEGDVRYIQSAMIPIEDAGKDQKPAPAPQANDQPAPEDNAPPDPQLSIVESKSLANVTEIIRRLMAREEANKHLEGDGLAQWIGKHREYCREVLMPATLVLGASMNAADEAVEVGVMLFLSRHFQAGGGTPESKATELRDYIKAAAAAKEN